MRRATMLTVILVVVAGVCWAGAGNLGGPSPTEHVLTLTVTDNPFGIVRTHNEAEVTLAPMESLRFECDCPAGVEFGVKDFHHVVNLTVVDSVADAVEFVRTFEEATESAAGSRQRADLDAMLRLLPERAKAAPGGGAAFEAPVPTDLAGYDKAIITAGYKLAELPSKIDPSDRGDLDLWKFTWVARKKLDDGQVLTDEWDPHFRGHRRR